MVKKAIVKIPNVAEEVRIGYSFNYLVRVIAETEAAETVQWDFAGVTFLHPFFLAPLSIYKNTSGKDIECINIPLRIQSYLNSICFDRMLHFGSETEALKLANEGYSTKNRPEAENRGYGISTSKEMLVVGMKGAFFMLSGGAFHRYENGANDYIDLRNLFRWQGTVVLMRIPVVLPDGFNYIDYLE